MGAAGVDVVSGRGGSSVEREGVFICQSINQSINQCAREKSTDGGEIVRIVIVRRLGRIGIGLRTDGPSFVEICIWALGIWAYLRWILT